MESFPDQVKEYLASDDALVRKQLFQREPGLQQTLADPETRAAILNWLADDQAWEPSVEGLIQNCLIFLQGDASVSEDKTVRSFLLHPNPYVRLRAYEFLLSLYFPDKNREALFLLLHGMLSDSDDAVRTQAARYIERAGAVEELSQFLERWYKTAPNLGWEGTESFELVGRLLQK